MAFLDADYLISNETGKRIFASIKDLPVVDPHNHANLKEIAENDNYRGRLAAGSPQPTITSGRCSASAACPKT